MELSEEDKYCRKCGGLVDLKNSLAKLTSPPVYQYYCSGCHALVLEIREGIMKNVQTKSN